MIEQSKLMEMLLSISEVARVQQNTITKEEIKNYFKGVELDESQFEPIYQYLGENGITIPGFVHTEYASPEEDEANVEPQETEEYITDEFNNENAEKPDALSLYMEELEELGGLEKSESTSLFLEARNGNETAKNKLIEGYLPVVVEIAEQYKDKGLLVEDLIQEGNIGLISGIAEIHTLKNLEDADEFLKEHIKMAIVTVIDEEAGESDLETTMVSKTSLINEAAKALSNDLGHAPSVKELSDYTQIPLEEVQDILSLSLDAVGVEK